MQATSQDEALTSSVLPFLKNIIPDLGPLSVLWVVVVTISQYSKGLGEHPAATKPLT